MNFNEALREGVIYISLPTAVIETARAASQLKVGRLYETNDETNGEPRRGRAVKVNKIEWDVTASAVTAEITAAVSTETTRAQTAEQGLATALDTESERAQAEENAIRVDFAAADASLQTALSTTINNLATALRDERVTDFSGYDYTASQSVSVTTLLGSTPREGIHLFKFNSTDINNTATVTGRPAGAANLTITYNDIVRVVVDGGVATSATLVDDALKAKFDSVDSSIAALEAATTASAIRSHISATGFVTFVNGVIDGSLSADPLNDLSLVGGKPFFGLKSTSLQFVNEAGNNDDGSVEYIINNIFAQLGDINTNGAFNASNGLTKSGTGLVLGGALTAPTTVSGNFAMNFTTPKVGLKFVEFATYNTTADVDGNLVRDTEGAGKVEMWFDADGDPKFTFIPNV